jgi:hypothetical protein
VNSGAAVLHLAVDADESAHCEKPPGCWPSRCGRCASAETVGRHRRDHIVDPRFVTADRFEFRSKLGLSHAAGSDDLQILLIAVEVGADLEPDPVGIKKIEGMQWATVRARV